MWRVVMRCIGPLRRSSPRATRLSSVLPSPTSSPCKVADTKIIRGKDGLHIDLQPTQDIAASLGRMKRDNQRLVCFALETNDEERHAEEKLKKKNADFIVLNSTRIPGTTLRSDDNQIAILSPTWRLDYPKKPKAEVAADIIDQLEKLF